MASHPISLGLSWPLTNRHLSGVAIAIHFHHSVCRLFQLAYWKDRNASAVARTSHRNGQCWPSTKLPPAKLGRLRQWQTPPETIPYLKLKNQILPKPLIPKKVRRKKKLKKTVSSYLAGWMVKNNIALNAPRPTVRSPAARVERRLRNSPVKVA